MALTTELFPALFFSCKDGYRSQINLNSILIKHSKILYRKFCIHISFFYFTPQSYYSLTNALFVTWIFMILHILILYFITQELFERSLVWQL
jgi:hypothetical protein